MQQAVLVIIGFVLGAGVAFAVMLVRRKQEQAAASELLETTLAARANELEKVVEQLKLQFSSLSREALSANSDDFLKLARTHFEKQTATGTEILEGKKKLIDARLEETNKKLLELNTVIQAIEKERRESLGQLKGNLDRQVQATNRLHETTADLQEALANPKRRGQWGERMAEDVLRLAGFVENVNYTRQETAATGSRPDFTFFLPNDRRVNMDVKFPLASYLKVLDADTGEAVLNHTKRFLRDVRMRIKEVTTREYIDPASGTVDYVIVFIPNEQIYGFIHENDPAILDDALISKVVLCSPLTLYAMLAVIRQSAEHYRLQQESAKILDLLASFKKQWEMFVKKMDQMGDRLENATKAYGELSGTRVRMLERQLDKIDDLREEAKDLAEK